MNVNNSGADFIDIFFNVTHFDKLDVCKPVLNIYIYIFDELSLLYTSLIYI